MTIDTDHIRTPWGGWVAHGRRHRRGHRTTRLPVA